MNSQEISKALGVTHPNITRYIQIGYTGRIPPKSNGKSYNFQTEHIFALLVALEGVSFSLSTDKCRTIASMAYNALTESQNMNAKVVKIGREFFTVRGEERTQVSYSVVDMENAALEENEESIVLIKLEPLLQKARAIFDTAAGKKTAVEV